MVCGGDVSCEQFVSHGRLSVMELCLGVWRSSACIHRDSKKYFYSNLIVRSWAFFCVVPDDTIHKVKKKKNEEQGIQRRKLRFLKEIIRRDGGGTV